MSKRKSYSAGFKTKVVLELLQEREMLQEIARKYELHPSQISQWKGQFLSNADAVFERDASKPVEDREKDVLFKKVGQLQLEVDFLKKSIGEIGKPERMAKIDKSHGLSFSRQCELLDVPPSSFHYSPREEGSCNEELMRLTDEQYMLAPFYGVPRMTEHLRGLGHRVNYKRVRRPYRQMDICVLFICFSYVELMLT